MKVSKTHMAIDNCIDASRRYESWHEDIGLPGQRMTVSQLDGVVVVVGKQQIQQADKHPQLIREDGIPTHAPVAIYWINA